MTTAREECPEIVVPLNREICADSVLVATKKVAPALIAHATVLLDAAGPATERRPAPAKLAPPMAPLVPRKEQPTGGVTADADEPPVISHTWVVFLRREVPYQRIGLILDEAHDFFCVKDEPSGGLIMDWNERNHDLAVHAGDVLLEVNCNPAALAAGAEVLETIRTHRTLRLVFKRYTKFTASVEKADMEQPLGLKVSCKKGGALRVDEVSGAVAERNVACRAGFEVMPGDIIEHVNGVKAPQRELADRLSEPCTKVDIGVRRAHM